MKIIPKFLLGGGFDSLYTTYEPVVLDAPRQSELSRGRSRKDDEDDEKGKLTEKDLFNMIKELDGLPNEMQAITTNLTNMLAINRIMGTDVKDLATTYILNLFLIRVALQNKAKYDEALKIAQESGSLQEPAIYRGHYVYLADNGNFKYISPKEYFNHPDLYNLLTVSDIGYLRRNDPRLNFNDIPFDIINNSVGFEAFLKRINQIKTSLGTNEYSRNGYFSEEGEASKGLKLLLTLSENDLVLALGSRTAQGLYEYKVIDKSQLRQINSLLSYIMTTMSENDKAWAAWKMLNPNKEEAAKNLIYQYLISGNSDTHSFDIDYKGTMDHVMGNKNGSKSNKDEDPKYGFWRQVQAGQGGDDSTFNLLVKKGTTSVNGKFYGLTPGPDLNCSLGDYINLSKVGYIVKNPNDITFGNVQLSKDSFNDVMVNRSSGAYVANLPTKNGKAWVEAAEVYSDFIDELRMSGLHLDSPEYLRKVLELLNSLKYSLLAPLLLSNGSLKPNNSGKFLILEGITSNKAFGISSETGNKQSFDEFNSNFIVNAGNDDELYRTVTEGLSTKERGEYKLDNNFVWWNNNKLYKGNIYIPLNNNPISGMNADSNEIKESTAYEYEEAQLVWNKRSNQGLIDSKALIQ